MREIDERGLRNRIGELVYLGDFSGPLREDKDGFYIESMPLIRDLQIGQDDELLFDEDFCLVRPRCNSDVKVRLSAPYCEAHPLSTSPVL